MKMTERIVAVFGATGTQGASVVDALLADKTFKPRAITRNASSDVAQSLKSLGVEVVEADLFDTESIKRGLSGCECVFGVTNYADPAVLAGAPDTEAKIGKALVDAAKEAGIRFFVWSSLPSCTKLSGGKYPNVIHFDNKATVEDYLKQSGLSNASLHMGCFAENLWKLQALRKSPSGYELTLPVMKEESDVYLSWVGHDLGPSVLALFQNYESHLAEISGKTFYVVSEKTTFAEFAGTLERVFGVPVKYVTGPKTGLPVLDEMFDMECEIGSINGVEIPDPRLVKFGVKFGTVEEFAESVKAKYV